MSAGRCSWCARCRWARGAPVHAHLLGEDGHDVGDLREMEVDPRT